MTSQLDERLRSLLTVAQAAESLGVSRGRVHQLMAAGRLQAIRLGCHWFVETSALEAVRVRPAGRAGWRKRPGFPGRTPCCTDTPIPDAFQDGHASSPESGQP